MRLNKQLAVTLISALLLSGCYADAGVHKGGPAAEAREIDRPQSDAPLSAPATLGPAAPAALPERDKEEIVDLSLG